MKVQHLFVAAVCAALTTAGWAQASRADVKEEARAANKAGQIPQGEASYVAPEGAKSSKTRAQRKAETRRAIGRGEVDHGGEADSAQARAQKVNSTRDRAQVKSETREAVKKGGTPRGEQ